MVMHLMMNEALLNHVLLKKFCCAWAPIKIRTESLQRAPGVLISDRLRISQLFMANRTLSHLCNARNHLSET